MNFIHHFNCRFHSFNHENTPIKNKKRELHFIITNRKKKYYKQLLKIHIWSQKLVKSLCKQIYLANSNVRNYIIFSPKKYSYYYNRTTFFFFIHILICVSKFKKMKVLCYEHFILRGEKKIDIFKII